MLSSSGSSYPKRLPPTDVQEAGAVDDSSEDGATVCAVRYPDGSVSLYVDEAYAIERGVDPARLVTVRIPRALYASGTVQQIREFVATYLEAREQEHDTAS